MENDNHTDKDAIYFNVLYDDLCSLFDTNDHINDIKIKQEFSYKKEMKIQPSEAEKDHCESLYYETLYNDLCDLFEKVDEELADDCSFEQKEPHKKDMEEYVSKDENEYYNILYNDLCDMFDEIDKKQSEDLASIPEESSVKQSPDSGLSIPDWGNIGDLFTNETIEVINKHLAEINYEFCTNGRVNINDSIRNCIIDILKRYNVSNFDLIDFLMMSGDDIVLEYSSDFPEKNLASNDINENIFSSQCSSCVSHNNIIRDPINNSCQPLFVINEFLWAMLSYPDYTIRISSFLSDNNHNIINSNSSPMFITHELLHAMLAQPNYSEYISPFLSDICTLDGEFLIPKAISHQKERYLTAVLDSTGITLSDSMKANTPLSQTISVDDNHQGNSSILVEKKITEGINFLRSKFMRNTLQVSSHFVSQILPSQTKNKRNSSTYYSNKFPRDNIWNRYCEITTHSWDDTLTSNDTSIGLFSPSYLKMLGDEREPPDRDSHIVMFLSKIFKLLIACYLRFLGIYWKLSHQRKKVSFSLEALVNTKQSKKIHMKHWPMKHCASQHRISNGPIPYSSICV